LAGSDDFAGPPAKIDDNDSEPALHYHVQHMVIGGTHPAWTRRI